MTERESLLLSAALQFRRMAAVNCEPIPSEIRAIEAEAGGPPTPSELLALCMRMATP